MYIGARFLSDCLVGILVGLTVGYGVYRLYLYIRGRVLATGYRAPQEIYHEGMLALVCALWVSIPVTLMMAVQVTPPYTLYTAPPHDADGIMGRCCICMGGSL